MPSRESEVGIDLELKEFSRTRWIVEWAGESVFSGTRYVVFKFLVLFLFMFRFEGKCVKTLCVGASNRWPSKTDSA